MKTNINKEEQANEWKRVFKVLPIKTEDGFRVMLGYVWKMETDDPFEPVRYHTNPLGDTLDEITKDLERLLDMRTEEGLNQFKEDLNKLDKMRFNNKAKELDKMRQMAGIRPKKPPPPPAPPAVCPKCGTTDCIPNEEYWKYITPFEPVERSVLYRSCNYRQGRKSVQKMKELGLFNHTQGTGPR